jgi:hypothetical protein
MVMSAEMLPIERALLTAAILLVVTGATAAWSSDNAMKRLAGLVIAGLGSMIALAVLGAPEAALIAGAAAVFAQLAVGAALLVRLQEGYGSIETPDVDLADAQGEAPEQTP